jgi:hypothetical protein
MKTVATIIVLGIAALLAGCASNANGNINGNWTASLMESSSSTPVFAFTTTLTEISNGGLSVTNLTFTTNSPCFAAGSTATGGFTLSGNQNGVTSGGFLMNIQSTGTSSNVLALQGTVNNNTITGTWTLTGVTAGCSGTGTFTMNKS